MDGDYGALKLVKKNLRVELIDNTITVVCGIHLIDNTHTIPSCITDLESVSNISALNLFQV